MVEIRKIGADGWRAMRDIRLAALQDAARGGDYHRFSGGRACPLEPKYRPRWISVTRTRVSDSRDFLERT